MPTAETNEHRVNDRIRAREVRLIDPEGKQLGVKPLPEALAVARQLDLDLVEVAPDASPPVVRIMDYNRFKYETAQRARESRKKGTNASVKEMKYRPKIGSGDFLTKTRQVARFLEEGHKVKVTITFRGREVSHPELGMKLLEDLVEQVSTVGKVEAAPKLDGKNMTMLLAPDRRARQAQRKVQADLEAASGPTAAAQDDGSLPSPNGAAHPEDVAAGERAGGAAKKASATSSRSRSPAGAASTSATAEAADAPGPGARSKPARTAAVAAT